MTCVDISNNAMYAEGAKAIASALTNAVLTELNISHNYMAYNTARNMDMSGVLILADAIKKMSTLSKFTFSGDDNSKLATIEASMTDARFEGKSLGVSGGMMLAAFLPKCRCVVQLHCMYVGLCM
jgi:hypothetical protein